MGLARSPHFAGFMDDMHPQLRPPVSEGEILADKYRVDKVIGVGGMGVVVAATHVELDQKVALKFLLPHAAASPSHVERFLREGKAAVRLRSEHVARVLDVGRMADGVPYIVMEYLEGRDLSGTVKERGALPIEEAVGYVLQTCDAVAEAHSAKIVHRDLKPDNLFVTARNDGNPLVKVLDFGISKTLDTTAASLTQTDSMVGSPAYMSPEQMRSSKNVDERSDIWSLGVILFELLTGRLPYIAESLPALAFKLAEEAPPSPKQFRPDLPDGLEKVVMKCLERDREKRMPDVGQLALALEPYASHADKDLVRKVLVILSAPARPPQGSVPEVVVVKSNPHLVTGGWGTTHAASSPMKKKASRLPLVLVGAGAMMLGVGIVAQRTLWNGTSKPGAAPEASQVASTPATNVVGAPPSTSTNEATPPPTNTAAPSTPSASAAPTATLATTAATHVGVGRPRASASATPAATNATTAAPPASTAPPTPTATPSAKPTSTTDNNGFIRERQ